MILASASAQTPPLSINSTSANRAPTAGPYTPVPQQPISANASHRVLVSNDLGMHCADFDARISSILPPFNVVHAQVLQKGATPRLLDDNTISVVYSAASNPNDPLASNPRMLAADGSLFKANFWSALNGYRPFYPPGVIAMHIFRPRSDGLISVFRSLTLMSVFSAAAPL